MPLVTYWDEVAREQRTREATAEEIAEMEALANPAAPALRHITKLAFRNRFTQAEKVAIELAAADNPAASAEARQQAAGLRSALADLSAADYIDLDRADTRAQAQGLEAGGLLGAGRALEILDAEIQPAERPVQ